MTVLKMVALLDVEWVVWKVAKRDISTAAYSDERSVVLSAACLVASKVASRVATLDVYLVVSSVVLTAVWMVET